ncbi:MAG: alpha/beta fold hydrolase [Fimbriimonadaceae bacterium]|nr:MAG: alpha/beta fold hydrolase [Fimbriimonadaceae bacterium]
MAAVAWFSVHPFRIPVFTAPGMMGEEQHVFRVQTDDGLTIKGWWSPAPSPRCAVVFCHGYMMNRCEFVPFTSLFTSRGASCTFFDFRAHGWSEGGTTFLGVEERRDVAAVVAHIREVSPGLPIVLCGASMGAAAAVRACATDPSLASALILDSPYERLDVATRGWWNYLDRGRWSRFLGPVAWFGRLLTGVDPKAVDTVMLLEQIPDIPILCLIGRRDPLLPPSSADRLLRACGDDVRTVWFEQSGHSEGRFHEPRRYVEEMFSFLESLNFLDSRQENWIKSQAASVE